MYGSVAYGAGLYGGPEVAPIIPSATDKPRIAVQVAFTTDPGAMPVWTTITDDKEVLRRFSVNRGRSTELDRFQAGRATITLANEDRRFDPTQGPTNQWVDLPGTSGNYLSTPDSDAVSLRGTARALRLTGHSGTYVSTPDSAALSITSDLDVRIKVALDNWTPTAAALIDKRSGNTGWEFRINGSDRLELAFGTGAATNFRNATAATGFAGGSVNWVRATLDLDNGAVGHDVKFYTSPDGVTWTQLGTTVTTAGVTTLADNAQAIRIGEGNVSNRPMSVHYAEVRNGIDGPVVAAPDFTSDGPWQIGDQASTARSDGLNTWTLNGNAEVVATAERRSLRLSGASGMYASTPDSAALDVVGDIDVRVKVALDDWTPATTQDIVSKFNGTGNQRSWDAKVTTAGNLEFTWSNDGIAVLTATSTTTLGLADGSVKWLRWTLDVDNGAAGRDAKFYTSDDGMTYTQLGATVTSAGVTSIFNSTAAVELGGNVSLNRFVTGNVFYAEVRNGIGGTVVANPDFTSRPWDVGDTAASTGADTVGNTWTLNGAGAVIQRAYASDLDVRVKLAMDDWTPGSTASPIAKMGGAGQKSWQLYLDTTGWVRYVYSREGVNERAVDVTAATGFTDGGIGWIRLTHDVDNGAGQNVVSTYKSTDGASWTLLGTSTSSGTVTIFDSTTPLTVGGRSTNDLLLAGNVFYAEVRNGIDGPVVARFDANAQPALTTTTPTTVTGGAGETWTLNGTGWVWGGVGSYAPYWPNVVPMRRIRILANYGGVDYSIFSGYVDSWEQQYMHPQEAVCVVQATDAFKVFANAELLSSAYAEAIQDALPTRWWRLGDSSGATQAVESVTGSAPLTPIGSPTFGAASLNPFDPDGAVQFTTVNDGLQGIYPEGTFPFTTSGSIEYLYRKEGGFGINPSIVGLYVLTPSPYGFDPGSSTVGVRYLIFNSAGTMFDVETTGVDLNDQLIHHIVLTWATGSPVKIYVDGVDRTASTVTFTGTMANTTNKWAVVLNAIDYPPFVNVGSGSIATYDEVAMYSRALTPAEVASHAAALNAPWAGDKSGTRINRLLDTMPWPAADREIDAGVSELQASTLGGSVLAALQKVEENEQGALFVAKDGDIRFIARDAIVSGISNGAFGDSGSELEYADLAYVYDDQIIFNEVQVSREGGITQVVGDATSQARYLRRTKVFDGMLYDTDTEARGLGDWWVAHYKDPLLRATNMRLEPSAGNSLTHFPHVLGRDLMDRVTVRRRPQNLGSAIDQETLIEGITHDVTPDQWVTTWNLSPAEAQVYWLAGIVGRSEAGVTTRAAF